MSGYVCRNKETDILTTDEKLTIEFAGPTPRSAVTLSATAQQTAGLLISATIA